MRSALFVLLACALMPAASYSAEGDPAGYVGRSRCETCHADQAALWSASHHDLAMQAADEKSVLGDFDDAILTHFDVTSTFFRRDDGYWVRTEGTAGKLQEYEIKYTFGVEPLQQYLIEFPGGRLQALSLAWDTRPEQRGGQRWFHLYPDEKIAHDDELHWTRANQNWNSMCAECHSTRLEKNYDPAARAFSTSWSEIDVSCEACHGPGSDHLSWAERKPGWEQLAATRGLAIALDERKEVQWRIDPHTGNALRSKPRATDKEVEMCARCHARRSPISSNYVHGTALLDSYLPRLLDEGMYFADGQMDGEAYVYGSFVQSKMYRAGVTCSDCHEPHSLALRAPGNAVCLQCHQGEKYDVPEHHFHPQGSAGASCAECHMPPRTYMVVDPRHDHSMRIPRPDLSAEIGVPNACNNCHEDKQPQWAADQVKAWYGHTPDGFQSYAKIFHAARSGQPGTGDALAALIRNTQMPDIARATALAEIGPRLGARTVDVLTMGLSDDSAMVREATVRALEFTPAEMRVRLAFPMLSDPVLAVRIEAAQQLASFPAGGLIAEQQALLKKGLNGYVAAQQAMAERPEAQTNLGNLYAMQGDADGALAAYETAISIDPEYVPGYVNLSDLYRARGNEAKAEEVLRRAAQSIQDSANIHHVLGLSLARQKRNEEAVAQLRRAVTLSPENPRFVYVYAVALNSTGKPDQAIMVLQGAHNAHPNDREILRALIAFLRDSGNDAAARSYAQKLRSMSP